MEQYLEWLGYLASLIVLISLLMSSVKKLRWINLIGSMIFAIYGFLIGSIPVGLMNIGIILINIYYLFQMYTQKDYFKLLPMDHSSQYTTYFIKTYQEDIESFIKIPDDLDDKKHLSYFVLRNTMPAGLFILNPINKDTLEILVDYVTPTYQDFKLGTFIFKENKDYFKSLGYQMFVTSAHSSAHEKYLKRMGFQKTETGYQKAI
ncbi:MAG: YgjV family protein [Acholeplasmataceae bacterium]